MLVKSSCLRFLYNGISFISNSLSCFGPLSAVRAKDLKDYFIFGGQCLQPLHALMCLVFIHTTKYLSYFVTI